MLLLKATPRGRSVLIAAAITAVSLLFAAVAAVPANSEVIDDAAAAVPATESSAPAEQAEVPAAESPAPVATPAADGVVAASADAVDAGDAPVSSPPPSADPVTLPDSVSTTATKAVASVSTPDVPSADRISERVEQLDQAATEAVASADATTSSLQPPVPARHLAQAAPIVDHAAQAVRSHDPLKQVRESLGHPAATGHPPAVTEPLLEGPPGPAKGGLGGEAPALPDHRPAGSPLSKSTGDLDGHPFFEYLASLRRSDLLLFGALVDGDPEMSFLSVTTDASGPVHRGAVLDRSEGSGPAPLPRPASAPLGGSSLSTAPGPAGSFFVPLVALLALLALAAAATFRRLGEAPDFRLPAPFVCALERPG